MATLVALRFSDVTTQRIYDWFKSCAREEQDYPLLRPIHPDFICIPLALCGTKHMDGFKPLGKINWLIQFKHREIRYLGERQTVVMAFKDEWVRHRMEELIVAGFKHRHKKLICRLPMSIHSSFLNTNWVKSIPFTEAMAVEEVVLPFDNRIGEYAHLGKEAA